MLNGTKVIVVGAGVAGLTSGKLLQQLGANVVVIEASDYVGGRIKQDNNFLSGKSLDLGAEFIHGSTDSMLYNLFKNKGWPFFMCNNFDHPQGQEAFYFDNKLVEFDSQDPDIVHMLQTINDLGEEIPSGDDKTLRDHWLREKGLSERVINLADSFYGKTFASSLRELGLKESAFEERHWRYGNDNYKPQRSFRDLIEYLKSELDIMLNARVSSVNYANCDIRISLDNGLEMGADYVVVTVPVTVIRDDDIKFTPPLPEWKMDAARKIGMGHAMKVICKFRRRFWPSKLGIVVTDDPLISQFWMTEDNGKEFTVKGFVCGEQHFKASMMDDDQVVQHLIDLLDRIFGDLHHSKPATQNFSKSKIYDWTRHPYIRGAYSFPAHNAFGMRYLLAEPVEGKVFFAGEATNVHASATVQSAMESGSRCASEIVIRKSSRL
eukprot:gb/GECH01006823.1/.p1 GENE.gb/GECH01006823.1/~~gb/GECH01006823.1/.p1  ORF type:complete len:436 (+),score=114.82 gb/GECH01006823.1/:1-1308(+)